MSDKETGLKVLRSFWKWNGSFNGSVFKLSFNDFLLKIQPDKKKLDIALDSIGMGIREAEISDSKIESAMRTMAIESKGKTPSNAYDFFKYLSNEAVKINYIDAVLYTAKESLGDVASGAQSIGKQLIFTGKIFNFLIPIIALIFLYSWVKKKTS